MFCEYVPRSTTYMTNIHLSCFECPSQACYKPVFYDTWLHHLHQRAKCCLWGPGSLVTMELICLLIVWQMFKTVLQLNWIKQRTVCFHSLQTDSKMTIPQHISSNKYHPRMQLNNMLFNPRMEEVYHTTTNTWKRKTCTFLQPIFLSWYSIR